MKANVFVAPDLDGGRRVILGEGPLMFDGRLLTTDARRCILRVTQVDDGRTENIDLAALLLANGLLHPDDKTPVLGCLAPTTDHRLLCATSVGLILLDLKTRKLSFFVHPEAERASHGVVYNDGKAGPDGAFYVGGTNFRPGEGRLLRVAPDGAISEPLVDAPPLTTPNGLHWYPTDDPDVWDFYYVCSNYPGVQFYEHRLSEGKMFRRPDVLSLPQKQFGYLDGMTGSDNEVLILALYESPEPGCIVFDRLTGEILDRVFTTAPQTTSVALNGDLLYVTSAAQGYTDRDFADFPDAGAVFRCSFQDSAHPKVRAAAAVPPFAFETR